MSRQTKPRRPGRAWFTRAEMANALDVSVQHFDRHWRRLAPAEAIQEVDGTLYFRARAILDAWVGRRKGESQDQDLVQAAGEPASAALERLRAVKADLARLEVQRERAGLINPADLRVPLDLLFDRLGQVVAKLREKYGADAAAMIGEAAEAFRLQVDIALGAGGGDG